MLLGLLLCAYNTHICYQYQRLVMFAGLCHCLSCISCPQHLASQTVFQTIYICFHADIWQSSNAHLCHKVAEHWGIQPWQQTLKLLYNPVQVLGRPQPAGQAVPTPKVTSAALIPSLAQQPVQLIQKDSIIESISIGQSKAAHRTPTFSRGLLAQDSNTTDRRPSSAHTTESPLIGTACHLVQSDIWFVAQSIAWRYLCRLCQLNTCQLCSP